MPNSQGTPPNGPAVPSVPLGTVPPPLPRRHKKTAVTGYIIFGNTVRAAVREELKRKNPACKESDVLTAVASRWRMLSSSERKTFTEMAAKRRADIIRRNGGTVVEPIVVRPPPPATMDIGTQTEVISGCCCACHFKVIPESVDGSFV
eukprot:TRINITY_DN3660_c0_g1_i2.p2 TRINITY_DN3660_c0_g1~~TRINITY_DN3660_c0_g1_i2.p2  ORF type:complete len:148 (-),score=33.51 TRINITY_DN3660_c0_g1_i2:70-513(-)